MPDDFKNTARSIIGPALGSFVIVPTDSVNLSSPIRAITLNVGGTLAWVNEEGVSQTTGVLPVGTYPLIAFRILVIRTSATSLTGCLR